MMDDDYKFCNLFPLERKEDTLGNFIHFFFSQYNDLMKKKRIVLNDKDKIASVIKELDEKKNEALRNAWKKVNKVRPDFNSLNSGQYILSYITDNKRQHDLRAHVRPRCIARRGVVFIYEKLAIL